MSVIRGTNRADDIYLGYLTEDNFVRGRLGDDILNGGQAADTMYGDAGNDQIQGAEGNDMLFGGRGDDWLLDDTGINQLWGGVGDDRIQGFGLMVGGSGSDDITNDGGASYGGEGLGLPQREASGDHLATDLSVNPWVGRDFFGGRGGDTFTAYFAPDDGVAARVDIRDFSRAEGDKLQPASPHAAPGLDGTFKLFDTNGDEKIDGLDPWSGSTGTWVDPNAHATVFYENGDLVAVWQDPHDQIGLTKADFLL